MIGTPLQDIRNNIERLASDGGEYYLACNRHGGRPVPAADLRFESRATARVAARATEQYRAALRRYDPEVPNYDIVVKRVPREPAGEDRGTDRSSEPRLDGDAAENAGKWTISEPVLNASRPGRQDRVTFCHRVAAVVFEALADHHEGLESAVMSAYFEHAKALTDPDDLCLCLLETMAAELDRRLTPESQATVLADAAGRLPPAGPTGRPVSATLEALQERGLLNGYSRLRSAGDQPCAVGVRFSEYALSPREGRLPVLPIVVERHRHQPGRSPATFEAVDVDGGWRLRRAARDVVAGPPGVASVPIRSER